MANETKASAVKVEYISSEENSPYAVLESSDGSITLSYPNDLGSQPQHRHVLRIKIYKQNKSTFDQPLIDANAFDTSRKAGLSKNKSISITDGAIGAAALSIGLDATARTGSRAMDARYTGRNASMTLPQKLSFFALSKTKEIAVGALALGATNLDLKRKTVEIPLSYINLYMPDSLIFGDRHDFKPVSLTDAMGTAGLVSQGKVGTGEYSGTAAEKSGIMNSGMVAANLFSAGYALNPQVEILYTGTTNRSFVFKFKFIPRNAKEADTIDSIIRTLRFHASPEYADMGEKVGDRAHKSPVKDSRYFVPPSEFEIEYLAFDENGGLHRNTKLPRIAQSVLTAIQTNYAGSGRFTAFNDNSPSEIDLELTFTETIVLTKEDIRAGY